LRGVLSQLHLNVGGTVQCEVLGLGEQAVPSIFELALPARRLDRFEQFVNLALTAAILSTR